LIYDRLVINFFPTFLFN